MRQVLLYSGESGFWVAECPSLPGCVSQGDTKETAIRNIREAIEGYVPALGQHGSHIKPAFRLTSFALCSNASKIR